MSRTHEDGILAPIVAAYLVFGEFLVRSSHGFEKPVFVDEWQQGNTLPDHLLAVHVDLEGLRIEVDDGRVFVSHQMMEHIRDVHFAIVTDEQTELGEEKGYRPSRWENTHELLIWLEGLSDFEGNVELINVFEVCRERSKVMRVIPVPGWSLLCMSAPALLCEILKKRTPWK
jgi:hypothetical protein